MAKKRKKPEPEPDFPPPLNMSDDYRDMMALDAGCCQIDNNPLLGTLTIVAAQGHYDFLINEELANLIIQALREFLAGDSQNLLD